MDGRLRGAVETSRRWYDDVFALHDLPVWCDDHLWVALADPPPWHSVVKTLTPAVGRDAVLAAMERHEHGSVADSFGTLDLSDEGFDLLIDATWLHHDGLDDAVWPAGWSVVRDAGLLAAWNDRHEYAEVLVPAVLDHPAFRILARVEDGGPVAGAVVHDAGDVAGLSNLWSVSAPLDLGDLLAAAAVIHPGRPVTDYAWDVDLPPLLDAGFAPLGPQRVWLR